MCAASGATGSIDKGVLACNRAVSKLMSVSPTAILRRSEVTTWAQMRACNSLPSYAQPALKLGGPFL